MDTMPGTQGRVTAIPWLETLRLESGAAAQLAIPRMHPPITLTEQAIPCPALAGCKSQCLKGYMEVEPRRP